MSSKSNGYLTISPHGAQKGNLEMKRYVAAVVFFIMVLYLIMSLTVDIFGYSDVEKLIRNYGISEWGRCYMSIQSYICCMILSVIAPAIIVIFFIIRRFEVDIRLSLVITAAFVLYEYVVSGL